MVYTDITSFERCQFFPTYPQIVETLTPQLAALVLAHSEEAKIRESVSPEFGISSNDPLSNRDWPFRGVLRKKVGVSMMTRMKGYFSPVLLLTEEKHTQDRDKVIG
jgi:hypothetical protein